jgi:hypothetical protein
LDQPKENDKEIEESCKLLSEWDIVMKEGFFISEVSVCIRMYSHFQVGISREPEIPH